MNLAENNLSIRKATVDDAKTLCRWWNDGELMQTVGFPQGLGTTVEKVRYQVENPHGNNLLILEILGEPVGEANYKDKGSGIKERQRLGTKDATCTRYKAFGAIIQDLSPSTYR